MASVSLFSQLPELAARETRSIMVSPGGKLPAGEYGCLEFYCNDPGCDCRRVVIQVISREKPETPMATIIFGWEKPAYYQKRIQFDPNAGRDITRGTLDPLNPQSEHAATLLYLFQTVVADARYCLRLKRHYEAFRKSLVSARSLTKIGTSR